MPTRRDFLAAALASSAAAPSAGAAAPALPYGTLGRTGLKVSRLGFGCMITSDPSVLQRAIDAGINYFDTARGYQRGNNERMVGAALKERRKDVILSTKTKGGSREAALADLDTSLKTLGTDYVDLWYLHARGSAADISDDLLEAQMRAKEAGKIRFTGITTHTNHKEVIPAAVSSEHIDVIVATYNFSMDRAAMEPLLTAAHKARVGIIAMKVMAGAFKKKEQEPNAPMAALKWVLQHPYIDVAIPSMTDADQLEENLRAAREPFSDADGKALAAQLDFIRPLYCRMCGACTGECPQGLPVADVLRYLAYADGYGQFDLAREEFLTLPAALQSVRCSDCETCAIQCPNGVQVARQLSRAQELFA
jgi:aryl-alcohol dehydrogenase-like predicted oxidoreductase